MVRHWFRRPARRTAATGSHPAPVPLRSVQPIGPPPTPSPYPVTLTTVPGFGAVPIASPPPASCFERAAAVARNPQNCEVRQRILVLSPIGGRGRSRRPARSSAGSAASEKPATNVVSMPSATQCAAVRIRSPSFESSTPAVHVCRSPAPRNSAPILRVRRHGGGGHLRRRRRLAARTWSPAGPPCRSRPSTPAARSPAPPTPAWQPILPDRDAAGPVHVDFRADSQANETLEVAVF